MTWFTWALLSALFAAATAILAKAGVAGIDSNVATAVRTSVVVVFTWLLAYLQKHDIPYYAFRTALPGRATGPHIHLGPGSTRLRAAD